MPEQFVMPVLAVKGEHAVGGEAFLALAHLTRILDQIKAVQIHARGNVRGGGPSLGPARRLHHLFTVPLPREGSKLAMLLERRRRRETVLGHCPSSPSRP